MIDLDEFERLEKAAPPGPWRKERCGCVLSGQGVIAEHDEYITGLDLDLLVAARNALPEFISMGRDYIAVTDELEKGVGPIGFTAHVRLLRSEAQRSRAAVRVADAAEAWHREPSVATMLEFDDARAAYRAAKNGESSGSSTVSKAEQPGSIPGHPATEDT